MEVVTVFTVTEYKTNKQWTEYIDGCGQAAIREIRKLYPKFTKFVIEGFEIRGNFKAIKL